MSSDDDHDHRDINLDDDDEDDEYRPSGDDQGLIKDDQLPPPPSSAPTVAPPQKRGRKPHPNPAVRSAREAARRANHSVIEKRRREKINGALMELRTLVPHGIEDSTASTEQQSNESKVKEYKLEVLVRTVSYLKHLIQRVNTAEAALAQSPNSRTNATSSIDHVSQPRTASSSSAPLLCHNCEGPINASNDLHLSRRSTDIGSNDHKRATALSAILNPSRQLPSPPLSGSLTSLSATSSSSKVPSFQLPTSSISLQQQLPPSSGDPVRQNRRASHSGDEQIAASLLLNMSRPSNSSSSASSTDATLPPILSHLAKNIERTKQTQQQLDSVARAPFPELWPSSDSTKSQTNQSLDNGPHTPSSMLGIKSVAGGGGGKTNDASSSRSKRRAPNSIDGIESIVKRPRVV